MGSKGQHCQVPSWDTIKDTVDYDFGTKKDFSYKGLSMREVSDHVAKFASGIWQIHPFPEGNTRATAVFIIKYLNSLGYKVNNEPFANHSWYFRNALVRANYNNLPKGVIADSRFLEAFFGNMLLSESNELKNRFIHLEWVD